MQSFISKLDSGGVMTASFTFFTFAQFPASNHLDALFRLAARAAQTLDGCLGGGRVMVMMKARIRYGQGR